MYSVQVPPYAAGEDSTGFAGKRSLKVYYLFFNLCIDIQRSGPSLHRR
jgi:hypothetical protein